MDMDKLSKFSIICSGCSFVFDILGKSTRKEGNLGALLKVYLKNTSQQKTRLRITNQNIKIYLHKFTTHKLIIIFVYEVNMINSLIYFI